MREIIQEALASGYLSLEAENRLRKLLVQKCQPEDISAFMRLHRETTEGNVKQESRNLIKLNQKERKILENLRDNLIEIA